MLWLFTILFALASAFPFEGEMMLQDRGLPGFLSCFRPPARAELPRVDLGMTRYVDSHVFARPPTEQQLPFETWSESGPGHTMRFRAWRTPVRNQFFEAMVEVHIDAPLDMFISFGGTAQRQGRFLGLEIQDNGPVSQSGTSDRTRRIYSFRVGPNHQNIEYWMTGRWG
ncbi:hypothetical protein BDZ85DRAFT_305181 [Elsinoe ampelina]|uniref:Uncharacterized protein n=1 Tax=Elsinoe ampelina TaxID=302913 RepID=A0A6A6GKF0_9PEZI|nr:hypothetical protein BDZ85DRAFT_305181 [Elsinoe ampelina]